jgi:hypothetical protein
MTQTIDPHVGDTVKTPRGQGIVLQRVGTASGNGVLVFLTSPLDVAASAASAPIFSLDELEEGEPLPDFRPADTVTAPGGYPGKVTSVDGETVVCTYRVDPPNVIRHGRFPRWRVAVANVCGK